MADAIKKSPPKAWPQPILKYAQGDMAEEDLLRVASDDDERTEADAYVGVVLWLSGAADKARKHAEWCATTVTETSSSTISLGFSSVAWKGIGNRE